MVVAKKTAEQLSFPAGYYPIPIHLTENSPLRVCVVAREAPDPMSGPFVVLRDLADAVVYLGCVTDAAGRVHEWIELWVQTLDGLEGSLPGQREAFSNHGLDARWTKLAESFKELAAAD